MRCEILSRISKPQQMEQPERRISIFNNNDFFRCFHLQEARRNPCIFHSGIWSASERWDLTRSGLWFAGNVLSATRLDKFNFSSCTWCFSPYKPRRSTFLYFSQVQRFNCLFVGADVRFSVFQLFQSAYTMSSIRSADRTNTERQRNLLHLEEGYDKAKFDRVVTGHFIFTHM